MGETACVLILSDRYQPFKTPGEMTKACEEAEEDRGRGGGGGGGAETGRGSEKDGERHSEEVRQTDRQSVSLCLLKIAS